ncbi:MAG TPA: response regulator [Polyangiaceae bacterium]|jgi:DNA-binding response OmpR family regulator|nr:response regulator [Polyangiaceae bacterium]
MTYSALIVDDSLTVRMDLTEAFSGAGFEVAPCATLAEARVALSGKQIDVAVLDIQLPDGDGFELLAEIRAMPRGTSIPILLLSTSAEVESRIRGLKVGADDYVGKPYDRGYVVSRAHELLRTQRATEEKDRLTVLIIDDSVTFRNAVRTALEGAGYSVLAAGSGEEGLRLAADNRPAALIVDGVLSGIDGATVIRSIRLDAVLRRTPCVLLTGSEDVDSELRALDAGADAFVRKEEDFEVILARLTAVLRRAHFDPDEGNSLLGAKRVLVVDDDPAFRGDLADAVRNDGYDVVLASSGEEALDMLAAQPVDCILMDLVMPGMGGKEATRRVKDSPVGRDVPLIVITAVDDPQTVVDVLAAGADDFITKTVDFGLVRARVKAQLRRRQVEDEHRRAREDLLRRELEAASARATRKVAETRAVLVDELERKNRELEAFSYSVSHDLRAPLRSIQGFTGALLVECGDDLNDNAKDYLGRVRAAADRMGELIEDMLELSRVSRAELRRQPIDLARVARIVATDLERKEPERKAVFEIKPVPSVDGDGRLLRILLDNLLGNAWKFTTKTPEAHIEFGAGSTDGPLFYYVRDNGAGFDMKQASRLFSPFQRLHNERDYPGTGIGLATVQRIVDRHGGRVWAEGVVGEGATIKFTIPPARESVNPGPRVSS